MKKFLLLLVVCLLFGGSNVFGAGNLLPNARQTFYDVDGLPLVGGKVYLYVPLTTTPKNSWVDINLTTLNTNPIILDALGSASIFGSGQYRQVVTDVNGNLIWDAITVTSGAGTFGLTVPPEFIATPAVQNLGSSIAVSKAVELPNTAWMGPSSGLAAVPTFRRIIQADLPTGTRLVFTGPTSFCITTTGLDANSGISPNCWLTLQHAWDYLNQSVDMAGQTATINIGAGGYVGFTASGGVLGATTSTSIAFIGDTVTPANVQIVGTTTSAVLAENGAQFSIGGVTLSASGSGAGQGRCLYVLPAGSSIVFNDVAFGFCQIAQLSAAGGTIAVPQGGGAANYGLLAGGSQYHMIAGQAGFIQLNNAVVSFSGTPPYSQYFAFATSGGQIEATGMTFSGAATGVNCGATLNGVINSGTGSPQTYFPGSTVTCPTSLGGQVN